MARNEEKNASLLNRFVTQANETSKGIFNVDRRRPHMSSDVTDRKEAEMWLRDVRKEISQKIGEIQNAGLGEHRIRDLNDEINKLLKVKWHWEERVIQLGGPNYHQRKKFDAQGKQISGQQGYQYFGAAQDLPGVRELFEREELDVDVRKTRKELFRHIKPDYYGWRDEEDAALLLVETAAEVANQDRVVQEWQKKQGKEMSMDELVERKKRLKIEADELQRAYVHVPTPEEMQDILLAKKKKNLLDKYMTADAQKEQEGTKRLVEGEQANAQPKAKMKFTKKADRDTKN